MHRTALLMIATVGMLLAGCEQSSESSGNTVPPSGTLRLGNRAPTVSVVTKKGKHTTLQKIGEPIYVVGFIETGKIDQPDPRMLKLAQDLNLENISVIQISEGTSESPQVAEQLPLDENNFSIYCDGKGGIALQAFGSPNPGTLYLIDSGNMVRAITTIDGNLTEFKNTATDLNSQWEKDQFQMEQAM